MILINVKNPNISCKVSEFNGPVTALRALVIRNVFFDVLATYPFNAKKHLKFCWFIIRLVFMICQAETIINDRKRRSKCREFAIKIVWYLPVQAQLIWVFFPAIIKQNCALNTGTCKHRDKRIFMAFDKKKNYC